jgi:hypothetical protein
VVIVSEQKPPDWKNDPLSKFLKLAEYNDRVTSLNHPAVFELLKNVEKAFKEVQEAVEHDSRPELLVPRFLITRTHSSFLAAIRLAMSGQITEAYPVLRQAIEQAWYALHISKDPSAPSRMEIWLRRNEDATAKAKCKQVFTIANVRSTHEKIDHATAKHFQELYKSVIDFGAHPNQLEILVGIAHSKSSKKIDYQVGILCTKTLPVMVTIRLVVMVAIGTLKIFQQIFPERFKIMSINNGIDELVSQVNSIFRPYIREKL